MPHTDTKTGLRAGVDKNGVPVGFQWDVVRTFTDDKGNVLGEARVTVPVTKEELRQHISAALQSRDKDIAEDAAARDALREELSAEKNKARERRTILRNLGEQVAAALAIED